MLTISDNTLAEEFGRLTALALGTGNSPDGAVKAVETELAKSHISLEKGHIADCSGLSPGSRLTASVLFHVIRYLRENANADALRGLPVVLDGKPVYSHDAAGRVRLKTGSLDTVSSVCGIILRKNGGFFYYTGIANVPDGWTKAGGYTALHTLANALVDL